MTRFFALTMLISSIMYTVGVSNKPQLHTYQVVNHTNQTLQIQILSPTRKYSRFTLPHGYQFHHTGQNLEIMINPALERKTVKVEHGKTLFLMPVEDDDYTYGPWLAVIK